MSVIYLVLREARGILSAEVRAGHLRGDQMLGIRLQFADALEIRWPEPR